MKIKKGDTVIVLAGADKGKRGKVLRALPAKNKVVVDGVNVHTKHQRPQRSNQKEQKIQKAMPLHVSNVSIVDPADGKPTRIGKKLVGDTMVRVSRKSGSTLN